MLNDLLFTYKEDHDQSYQKLIDAKVKIDLVMAFGNEDADGNKRPAIKKHGAPVYADTKIIGYKDRVLGRGDAEIMLDADKWDTCTEPEKKAILDRELFKIIMDLDDDGKTQYDDCRRPRLKIRKYDFQIGVFNAIAARHEEASQERQYMRYFLEGSGRYYTPELFDTGKLKARKTANTAAQATA